MVDTIEIAATWDRVTRALRRRAGGLAVGARHARRQRAQLAQLRAGHEPLHHVRASSPRTSRAPRTSTSQAWTRVMEATLAGGGTIAHHHGIGRLRVPWLERELGTAYPVLRAIKRALDPAGIMNPGHAAGREVIAPAGIVRPARRPAGLAAARAVAGRSRTIVPTLWPGPGEDLCHLAGDWRILQLLRGHRWSLDDLVTAWFAAELAAGRAAAAGRRPRLRHRHGAAAAGVAVSRRARRRRRGAGGERRPRAALAGVERRRPALRGAPRRPARPGTSARGQRLRPGDRHAAVPAAGHGARIAPRPVGRMPPRAARRRRGLLRRGGAAARARTAGSSPAPAPRSRSASRAGAARAGLVVARRRDVVPRAGKGVLFAVYGLRPGATAPTAWPTSRSSCVTRRDAAPTAFRAVRGAMGMPP